MQRWTRMLDTELKSKINQLWDKFWSGGISNPIVAIEQMSYLIFMKRLEDEDNKREQNSQLSGNGHSSVFKSKDDYKWSVWTKMSADKILNHVRDNVFPFLRTIGSNGSMYQQYMKDAIFVIPTSSLLIESVKLIDEMHIKEQNRDTKGDIYEYLLSQLTTAGKNGQFRTPRHIIKMMTELVDPKIGDNVCDPACGTAGFLISALEHILKRSTSKDLIKKDKEGNEYNLAGDKLTESQWKVLEEGTIHGYDIDQTMVRIALMNLMMHGIENPKVNQTNTLSKRYEQSNYFDVILANPPFKGSIDESDLSDSFTVSTKKTELLYLELMFNLLNQGGRCSVIVPDGVLFGNSNAHRSIRKMILEECRLDAVISMPSGVFKPYAGVSTGILVFTKGEPTKKVLFYDMQADGFTLDDKRTKIDGKGDIPDIIEKFKKKDKEKYEDRGAKCFFVPFAEIKEKGYDLSISKYKKIKYDEVKYEKPEVIKNKILGIENKIIKSLKELEV
jgi:type I restriction enzyme M protein